MAASTHKFQAPKGTRDFYPADMAVRRHIESVWRDVSINHGFDEIDGPTFEHLEMYTTKSGPGIVSELFSFRRAGGDVDYALRPEFTPTLARMYGARAAQLPKPVKWFVIESNFRAERPQRGRLREFFQWNADIIGDDSVNADAEIIAVAVGVLEKLGLTPDQVKVKISHRKVVARILRHLGYTDEQMPAAFTWLDKRDKLDEAGRLAFAEQLQLDNGPLEQFSAFVTAQKATELNELIRKHFDVSFQDPDELDALDMYLDLGGIAEWCQYDLGIVRGLAYYTGTVFEVIAAGERSVAGGGRYDGLVNLFGGPSTPAVGFAMGDVVLRLLLEDHELLPENLMPRPDAFVIGATPYGESRLPGVVAEIRRAGLHARHSYRATKNVGKLLGEAGKVRARFAIILGDEFKDGKVALKNLDTGDQTEIEVEKIIEALK